MRKEWEDKLLSEVALIGDGNHSGNYPKSSEMVQKGIPFIRATNMVAGKVVWNDMKFIDQKKHLILKKGHLKPGDILFTNRGEIGKIAIVGSDFEDANLNSQIAWFRCLQYLDNKFLFYFLSSPMMKRHYELEKNGAALQQFTIKQIHKIKIPIPPLSEQKAIVEKLDTAFNLIDRAKAHIEQNIQNAKELFQSKLNQVFSQKGEGWEEKKIEEVCESISAGGDAPKNNFSAVSNDNFSIPIFANAVKLNGLYGYTNLSKITKPSLTIAARGSGTGFTCIRLEPFFPIVRLLILTPNELVDLRFLKLAVDNQVIKSSGSAIPQFTVPMLKMLTIYLPNTIEKQRSIVDQVDQLSEQTNLLREKYKQKLANLEELKKSILDKAFKGELVH